MMMDVGVVDRCSDLDRGVLEVLMLLMGMVLLTMVVLLMGVMLLTVVLVLMGVVFLTVVLVLTVM